MWPAKYQSRLWTLLHFLKFSLSDFLKIQHTHFTLYTVELDGNIIMNGAQGRIWKEVVEIFQRNIP
jgi:hypothetical protein